MTKWASEMNWFVDDWKLNHRFVSCDHFWLWKRMMGNLIIILSLLFMLPSPSRLVNGKVTNYSFQLQRRNSPKVNNEKRAKGRWLRMVGERWKIWMKRWTKVQRPWRTSSPLHPFPSPPSLFLFFIHHLLHSIALLLLLLLLLSFIIFIIIPHWRFPQAFRRIA